MHESHIYPEAVRDVGVVDGAGRRVDEGIRGYHGLAFNHAACQWVMGVLLLAKALCTLATGSMGLTKLLVDGVYWFSGSSMMMMMMR